MNLSLGDKNGVLLFGVYKIQKILTDGKRRIAKYFQKEYAQKDLKTVILRGGLVSIRMPYAAEHPSCGGGGGDLDLTMLAAVA